MTQTYANNGTVPINARYVFPASTRVSVHGMKMQIGDNLIIAKIKEKEEAKQEFEQAKEEGKSASLLEQQKPNVFTMDVANIMPGDTVRIELHYTELIMPDRGSASLCPRQWSAPLFNKSKLTLPNLTDGSKPHI